MASVPQLQRSAERHQGQAPNTSKSGLDHGTIIMGAMPEVFRVLSEAREGGTALAGAPPSTVPRCVTTERRLADGARSAIRTPVEDQRDRRGRARFYGLIDQKAAVSRTAYCCLFPAPPGATLAGKSGTGVADVNVALDADTGAAISSPSGATQ